MIKGVARDKRPRNQDTRYKTGPAQKVWPQVQYGAQSTMGAPGSAFRPRDYTGREAFST